MPGILTRFHTYRLNATTCNSYSHDDMWQHRVSRSCLKIDHDETGLIERAGLVESWDRRCSQGTRPAPTIEERRSRKLLAQPLWRDEKDYESTPSSDKITPSE
jgi:hypothetical protein